METRVKSLVMSRLDTLDERVARWMAQHGVTVLRVAVGAVFVWFGALKLFRDVSPAVPLITGTFPFLPEGLFVPFLGAWEILIGFGYLSGRFIRVTVALMFAQMAGAMSPLLLNPDAIYRAAPFALTLEGQYVVKNVVLMAAALVIGATVHGRRRQAN